MKEKSIKGGDKIRVLNLSQGFYRGNLSGFSGPLVPDL